MVANPSVLKESKFRFYKSFDRPTAGGWVRDDLPITECIQDITLRLSGTITVASGSASGTVAPEGILSLIRTVEIKATSSSRREVGTLKLADWAALYRLQQILKGVAGESVSPADGATQTATAVSSAVEIDFEMPFSEEPRFTLLNATELSTLKLGIEWGGKGDIVNATNDRTYTFNSVTVKVSLREFTDLETKSHRYGLNTFSTINKAVTAASRRLLISLKRGYLVRGFLIKQFTQASGVSYHTPVETIINSIAIELDREPWHQFDDFNVLKQENKQTYGIESLATGYAFVDFMQSQRFDTLIDTRRYRDVDIVLDVNAITDGYVNIYPVEIIPSVL